MSRDLHSIGEFGLIDRIKGSLPALPAHRWIAGIGDDTSVLRLHENHYQLLTHDLLLEKIHFLASSPQDFADVGWKALAVNLSDIAAMGGVPQEAVVGIGIPAAGKLSQVDAFYRGLASCSRQYHCPVSGGDTNRSKGGWVFSVTVSGFSSRPPLLRRGGEAGDTLWVSGTLGGAALGWKAAQKGDKTRAMVPFRRMHAHPEPRLLWGQRLRESGLVTSMIDISDGLAGDLTHLSRVSGVGFRVELEALPRPRGLREGCRRLKIQEESVLLSGGEDYELLFTVKKDQEERFSQWLKRSGVRATRIGRATPGSKISFYQEGKPIKKAFQGYRHF
jgi:thiamine-monophosphate kinase